MPATWNPETNTYNVSPTQMGEIMTQVSNNSWAGLGDDVMLFTYLDISVDHRKRRIILTYSPSGEDLGNISTLIKV